MRDIEWMDRAACKGMDLAVFFPKSDEVVTPAAKAACARCPVKWDCHAYSVTTKSGTPEAGIWGGASKDERAADRRRELRHRRRVA